MKRVVISQPMFFPWVGMFEQARLADVYVHYDDVQFSKGSFTNRVQIKTASGIKWLTVPTAGRHLAQHIADVAIDEAQDWRGRQRALVRQALAAAPHLADALALLDEVHALRGVSLGELSAASFEACCRYLDLGPPRPFPRSSALGVPGKGSERVLALVQRLGGDSYVTGHGAREYLDHAAFEQAGVSVDYMAYEKRAYPQAHGAFTPYVSILDLVAHLGREGRSVIASGTVAWREFLAQR